MNPERPLIVPLPVANFVKDDGNELIAHIPATGNWVVIPVGNWDKLYVWITDIDIEGMEDVGAPGTISAVKFAASYKTEIWITATDEASAQRYWGHPVINGMVQFVAAYGAALRSADTKHQGGCHLHLKKGNWK